MFKFITPVFLALLILLFVPSASQALTVAQANSACSRANDDSATFVLSLYRMYPDYQEYYPNRVPNNAPPGVTPNKVSSSHIVAWVAWIGNNNRFGITYYCHVKDSAYGPVVTNLGTWWGPGYWR